MRDPNEETGMSSPRQQEGDTTRFTEVGDIILLKVADYLDGKGDVRVRLVHLPREVGTVRGLEWARVIGVEVKVDAEGPQRMFMVRVTALEKGTDQRSELPPRRQP